MTKLTKVPVLILALALAACQTPTVYKDRIVEVPKVVFEMPPAPADVEKLDLPIFNLTSASTDEEVAKAYVETAEILLTEARQHREASAPFRVRTPE